MKKITTLIKDIEKRLTSGKPFDEQIVVDFGRNLAAKLANRLAEHRGRTALRLSNLGTPCERKLWYSVNRSELAEPLPASARLKFLYGDVLEELILFLARAAGHTVEHEQATVSIGSIEGHIDGVVDGELVDVKSASSYSFRKFEEGRLPLDDPFGYLTQLGGYHHALKKSGMVESDKAHFLAIDKTLGKLTLDTHTPKEVDYEKMVEAKQEMLAKTDPPPRAYQDEPDGKSGNRKLGIACSYCPFKQHCWPGLRTFAYSRGPVSLTKVERVPDVPEITSPNAET